MTNMLLFVGYTECRGHPWKRLWKILGLVVLLKTPWDRLQRPLSSPSTTITSNLCACRPRETKKKSFSFRLPLVAGKLIGSSNDWILTTKVTERKKTLDFLSNWKLLLPVSSFWRGEETQKNVARQLFCTLGFPRVQVLKGYGQPIWVHHTRRTQGSPHPRTNDPWVIVRYLGVLPDRSRTDQYTRGTENFFRNHVGHTCKPHFWSR